MVCYLKITWALELESNGSAWGNTLLHWLFFFFLLPSMEQSLELWNHSALFEHGKQLGTSFCWKLPSLGWQKHLLPENFPLFIQSFMPVVTFMKSNEDALDGWLQGSILPCQLCPGAEAAPGDFRVAGERWSHRVAFWPHSPFNQWQRLRLVGAIVQPGVKSIAAEVGVGL